MPELPVARITINRTLTEHDDNIDYELSDGLSVLEAVGLLTMTIDSILTIGIATDEDDELAEAEDEDNDEDDE